MKKILTIIAILFVLTATAQNWIKKDSLPDMGRSNVQTFTIKNKAYIVGGSNSTTKFIQVWQYSDSGWVRKNDPPFTRHYGTAFTLKDKGYVVTGMNVLNKQVNEVWRYDPDSDLWTSVGIFPGTLRIYASGFAQSGYGYIVSGWNKDTSKPYLSDLWGYDPDSGSWALQPYLLPARSNMACFTIGDSAYFVGGSNSVAQELTDVYRFSQSGFTKLNPFPEPVKDATAFSIGRAGYVGTGYGGGDYLSSFYKYNPTSDSWTALSDFPTTRFHATSFSINGKGYVFGGQKPPVYFNDLYEMNESTGLSKVLPRHGVVVYPNPCSGILNIDKSIGEFSLISMEGKVLYSGTTTDLDVMNYPAGMYFIQTSSGYQKILFGN